MFCIRILIAGNESSLTRMDFSDSVTLPVVKSVAASE